MPIMGYNWGANNRTRFYEAFGKSMLMAMGYMTFGLIIFHTLPEYIVMLFSPDTAEKAMAGVEALRLCSIPFISAAVSVILIAMFNSIGHGTKAMSISILRQIVILIPVGYLLSNYTSLGVTGFWLAFTIGEVVTMLTFFPIAIVTMRKGFIKKNLEYEKNISNISDAELLKYFDSQNRHARHHHNTINWEEMA